jgi:hypothetical protein
MENLESPFVVLLQITEAFKVLDIDYVVVGSIASSIHGEYRASGDIDIVADLNAHHVEPLVLALSDKFYVDDLSVRRAIANCRSFNVINTEAIFKVDIFVPVALGKQQLARRELHRLDPHHEQSIWVATAEDTILGKLEWYRKSNESSEIQWRDILGIIGTRGRALDFDYLRRWSERFGLSNLLERALNQSE